MILLNFVMCCVRVNPFQACASNPYDPYYGGMVAAYGQPMVILVVKCDT